MKDYSVLMSVYIKEHPEHLRESIESMVRQTVRPEQFILVQDGPLTEELLLVIGEYREKYTKLFTVVPLDTNQGLGRALDAGLKHCRNELVARMDSDDISLPNRCEKQLARFEANGKLALLGTNIDEFYDDPRVIKSSRVVPSQYMDIVRFARRRNPFNHPTVMFKLSEVIRCGGYGKMAKRQDFDLFSRMINNGCYAENIDESLLLFRSNEDNYKRRKSWQYCSGYIYVQKRNYKRGYCSLWDLIFVAVSQTVLFIMPIGLTKWISDKLFRKKAAKSTSPDANGIERAGH